MIVELKTAFAPLMWRWGVLLLEKSKEIMPRSTEDIVFLQMYFFGLGWTGVVVGVSVLCLCQPNSLTNHPNGVCK